MPCMETRWDKVLFLHGNSHLDLVLIDAGGKLGVFLTLVEKGLDTGLEPEFLFLKLQKFIYY